MRKGEGVDGQRAKVTGNLATTPGGLGEMVNGELTVMCRIGFHNVSIALPNIIQQQHQI